MLRWVIPDICVFLCVHVCAQQEPISEQMLLVFR